MCDVRLFKSAYMDYQAAKTIFQTPYNARNCAEAQAGHQFPDGKLVTCDEMFFNNSAYHLQQCVEKVMKGALECVGVTVPNTHRIAKLLQMVCHNGANLIVTEWIDEHAEMLSQWEVESRYDMDFVVEKRKLERALAEIEKFLQVNGITDKLREELQDGQAREKILSFLPENKRECSDFDLNCYYIMFEKRLQK
ncbi:MAG: HEPN domain-containing protein [Clostridium sp.]|nr:HEPN domain-containing protein [Clostridium sp.]